MPIYEYRRPDGTTFEVQQSFSDAPLSRDPDTGVAVERVLHAPAVHFKGKGFYATDYGTRKRQRETAAAGEPSSDGGAPPDGASSDGASSDGASSNGAAPAGKDASTSASKAAGQSAKQPGAQKASSRR